MVNKNNNDDDDDDDNDDDEDDEDGDEDEEEEQEEEDDDDLKPMEHGYVYLGKIMSYPWIQVFTGEFMSLSLEKIGGTTPNNGYSLTCVKVSAEPVFGVLGDAWSTMVRTGGSSAKTWWNYSH